MSDANAPPASHPELALAPAFALGALDDDERARFEAHLGGCAGCAAEVGAHAEVAALLPYGLADAGPPPALRDRILAAAAAAPAARAEAASLDAARSARAARTARGRGARAWPGWLAAAAMALLAAGLGVRLGDERQARTTLAAQLGRARQTLAERERALAEQRALVAEVISPDARTARLAATGQGPDVRVTWNRRTGLVVLTAASLGPAPAGRTYQLWGIPAGGAPQSLGTFAADVAGSAGAVLRAPAGAAFGAIAVSVEPDGGSPAPTTTPILVGQVGN